MLSRRDTAIIARRFIAGKIRIRTQAPKGRPNSPSTRGRLHLEFMLWSNIVLTALMPYVSDYSARLSSKEWIKRFDPKVRLTKRTDTERPILPSSVTVPRCAFHWETSYRGTACVEVDLESNTVKSLQFD